MFGFGRLWGPVPDVILWGNSSFDLRPGLISNHSTQVRLRLLYTRFRESLRIPSCRNGRHAALQGRNPDQKTGYCTLISIAVGRLGLWVM